MPPKNRHKSEPEVFFYQIIVEGTIDSSLSPLLHDMEISTSTEEGSEQYVLTGQLTDQAALSGIIDTLIDRRFKLLSVNRIGKTNEEI